MIAGLVGAALALPPLPTDAAIVRGVVVDLRTRVEGNGFVTRYTIAVEEVLHGTADSLLEIDLPGGRLLGRVQEVSHVPLWAVGDDVVSTVCVPSCLTGQFVVDGEALLPTRDRWPAHVATLERELRQLPR